MNNPSNPLGSNTKAAKFSDYDLSKGKVETGDGFSDCCFKCMGGGCAVYQTLIGCPCGFTCYGPIDEVKEGFVGIVYRNGKLHRKIMPGMHFVMPMIEQVKKVDVRNQILNTTPQTLLTIDSVTITVDAYCQFQIVIPEMAVMKCESYINVIRCVTMGAIKTIFAEHT